MFGQLHKVHQEKLGGGAEGALMPDLLLDVLLDVPVPALVLTELDEVSLSDVSPHA